MPIYLLGTYTRSVEIRNEPIRVSLLESNGGAELRVSSGASQRVVRINAQAVALPSITETSTVAVEPVDGTTFGHDTVVQLVIGPDAADRADEIDPVQVTFDPVNVSGCRLVELAALTPCRGGVEITVLACGDTPLSPLASMARTAARRSAGARCRSPGERLSVGVDTSASMWRAFRDGSVAAAVELIVGVADAIEIHDITANLIGADCTAVDAPAAQLAEAVVRGPLRWSAGVRWSRMPPAERAILLTDAMDYAAQQRIPAMWISADTRFAEQGALLAPPPAGVDARRYLADHPAVVDGIVTGLLREMT